MSESEEERGETERLREGEKERRREAKADACIVCVWMGEVAEGERLTALHRNPVHIHTVVATFGVCT